jgi:WXG100 family type VII secretion target
MSSFIRVEYGNLADTAASLRNAAAAIEEILATLRIQLQQITWDGQDRAAYQAAQARWDRAIADLNELLAGTGSAVDVAREEYARTEQANVRMWDA